MQQKRIKSWVFLSIFLAVLLCHINIGVAQTEDKPVIRVDYVAMLNVLNKAGRDENLNAAAYYKKAFELCVELPEQISEDIKAWPKDLPKDKQIQLQNWVSANSDALEQLKLGAQKPYYWVEYQGRFIREVSMPDLVRARMLTQAICCRAKLYAAKGDFKEAFSDLLVCYKFGTHFTGPKTLIEQLVGVAIRATAQVAFEILDKTRPDTDVLKDFQRELRELSAGKSYAIDFTAERLAMYDDIQRVFTDDGEGGGHISKKDIEQAINMLWDSNTLSSKERQDEVRKWEQVEGKRTTELVDRLFGYSSETVHKMPWQFHNEGKELDKVIEEMTEENPFAHMLTPAISRILELAHRSKAETGALIVTLGLLQYKAEKGQFPTNLSELVSAGYLKELPIDPYSGKPLVYKRTEDNFLLYSFGADFDDDSGVRSKWGESERGGDQVFWPVQSMEKPEDK